MADTMTIREVEENDIPAVLDVLRAALGETPLLRRTQDLYAWKHLKNPFGRSIALLAEVDGQVAGLRTLMRWELATPSGATLRCVRAVDTATHPDFTRRGIFRRLTEEALERAADDAVDLVFNTPNESSGAGYLSMGWVKVGKIGVMARPRLSWDRREPEGLDAVEQFIEAPDPISDLTLDDRAPLGLRTPRTNAYLRWRFGSHPTARYFRIDRGDSTAVVRPNIRNSRSELLMVDIHGPEPAAVARETARRSRAAYAATWFSKGSPERSAALRAGFMPVPGVKALTLVARPLRELDVDVSSMSSWDFSISDLELL